MSRHTARDDNDRWDLASSVGATATMVATSRALASRSQLACEYVPDMSVFGHEALGELFEQSAVDIRDLVYQDTRSHVPDHLGGLGWFSTLRTAEQLYAANGRHYPAGDEFAMFADVTYLRAELD